MEPANEPEPEGQSEWDTHGGVPGTADETILEDNHDAKHGCAPGHDSVSSSSTPFKDCRPDLVEAARDGCEANDQAREPSLDIYSNQKDTCEQSAEPNFLTPTSPEHCSVLKWRWWRRRRRTSKDGEPQPDGVMCDLALEPCGCGTSGEQQALEGADAQRWAVVDRKGEVVAEDDGLPLTTRSVEAQIEQLLTFMLAPAVHGVPKLGLPSAVDRANELLASAGDVEAAVREVVAGSETTVSMLVSNFCLERIPFLGLPTVLLKTVWSNLRSILIIAALYGHDLERPRTHHEALLCLVPPGDASPGPRRRGAAPEAAGPGAEERSPLVADTTQQVARVMIRSALRHATGLQAAVDCFELASLLYRNCAHESTDEDGYVCIVATPASAARDFFRRKSLASCALLWGSLALLLLGTAAPHLFTVGTLVPKTGVVLQALRQLPRWISAALVALPGLVLALRAMGVSGGGRFRRWGPDRLWWRLTRGREARMLQDAWPQIVTLSVLTLHAVLPAISAFSSVTMVLDSAWMAWVRPIPGWDRLHGFAHMLLGLYSFCACVTQYLKSEKQDAIAGDAASRTMRALFRFFTTAWVVMRACCILAAWTYALLALDLAATRAERWMSFASASSTEEQQASTLGIVGPMAWFFNARRDTNPLWSEKAVKFSLSIISVGCQQRLVDLLARREVLLRLIGAERITAQTVCLLMKGVAVAFSQSTSANPIQEFFESVTPPPACCVLVVAVRAQAVVLGSMLAVAPRVTAGGLLGSAGSFACGLLGGAYAAHAVLHVWYENQDELDSPALRLALLVPGSVSGKAKGLLSGAITRARKRAVQLMAKGLIQRILRWCFVR